MIKDNKIELSSLSIGSTQQGHQNGYHDYPLKCFTAHVCMNMIAERTRNVNSEHSEYPLCSFFLCLIGQAALSERMGDKTQ